MSTDHLDVMIMGREYRVACAPEEQPQLLRVVELVDGKMTDIAARTRNAIPERVAVMAAMSIAHELLAQPAEQVQTTVPAEESGLAPVSNEVRERLCSLVARIDGVLQNPVPGL